MYPKLITIWKFDIHTYGFFLAVAFVTAILIAKRIAANEHIDSEKIVDLCFYGLLGGIICSRLFYVLTNLSLFKNNFLSVFKIWEGGLVFYGGFIGALLTAIIYIRRNHMFFWKIADILAIPVAIGHSIGRIGCFFAGCCHGKQCDLPWAVVFNNPDTLASPMGEPLHPTQLYSAASNFLIAMFLLTIRRKMKFDGQLFWIYILLYGIIRFILEIFRGDFRGEFVFGILSVSQTIGSILALLAIIMLVFLKRRTANVV